MIPKIIHYCWFGRGEMPELAKKCIASWKEYLPDYEIKEWNEDNFELSLFPYTQQAYENRKYAFVTDVVRLYALYNVGGIYMDTDVEVLSPLDDFLNNIAFSGYEDDKNIPTGIMAAEKGSKWAKDNLDYYNNRNFIVNGQMDLTTNITTITNNLLKLGLRCDNTFQDFEGYFTIYPKDYFCPKSYQDGKIYLTENTHTIHHFAGSWQDNSTKLKRRLSVKYPRLMQRLIELKHFIKNLGTR